MTLRVRLIVCLAAVGLSVGCGGGLDPNDMLAAANTKNIERLANLYSMYQIRNNLRGPSDESEFKAFIGKYAEKLERIGVDPNAIDDLFVNERDGEPFKIRYGVPGGLMGSTAPVVFEATGANDMRMVGSLDMTVKEVDAAEYDQLWSGATDPANSATARR